MDKGESVNLAVRLGISIIVMLIQYPLQVNRRSPRKWDLTKVLPPLRNRRS